MTGKLPKGWKEANLEDFATKVVDGSHNPPKAVDEGKPMLSARNIANNKINFDSFRYIPESAFVVEDRRTRIEPNDVLLTIVGTIGRTAVVPASIEKFTLQRSVAVISTGKISPKYFSYHLRSPLTYQSLLDRAKGTAQKGIYLKELRKTKLNIPPSNEQHRIVDKIDSLIERSGAAKEALDTIPKLLDQYRQSVLASAFRGDLTKDWREKNPNVETASKLLDRIRIERRQRWEETELAKMLAKGTEPKDDKWKAKYKNASLIEKDDLTAALPITWFQAPLELVSNVIDPNPSHRMPKYIDNGIPFLSTENFEKGEGWNFSKGKKVEESKLEEQLNRYQVQNGDFVLSRIGTIGKTRYLPIKQDYCLSHALCVIQPRSNYVVPEFLRLVAASDAIIDQAHSGVQSVGVPDLGMAKIREFTIPIPPIDEQLEIIKKCEIIVSQVENIKHLYQQSYERLGKLNQSILAKAFRGELVPQDENDEPASILLDRIRQERAKAEANKPKRGRRNKG